MNASSLEAAERELSAADLDAFVETRTRLVRELRRSGERDAAAALSRARKPSAAVWALNRLARRHPREMQRLLDAGERLEDLQAAVLTGDRSKSDALREAGREQQRRARSLTDIGAALLTESGHAAVVEVRRRLHETLTAAALSGATREQLREGTLDTELRPQGFAALTGVEPDDSRVIQLHQSPRRTSASAGAAASAPREKASARPRTRPISTELLSARRQAREAEEGARRAVSRAERLHQRAGEAAREAADAQRAAQEASRQAREARARQDKALVHLREVERRR